MAEGAKPPLSIMEPSLLASSPSLEIASINSFGGGPEFSVDLTNIMKRIVGLLCLVGSRVAGELRPGDPSSHNRSNGRRRERQPRLLFFNTFLLTRLANHGAMDLGALFGGDLREAGFDDFLEYRGGEGLC